MTLVTSHDPEVMAAMIAEVTRAMQYAQCIGMERTVDMSLDRLPVQDMTVTIHGFFTMPDSEAK